jgi:protoporphyrinogen oxidase
MTVFVLGGGPAGLAVAHGLAQREPAVLLEREATLGGLAKTVVWDDHGSHDLGPHKLFSRNAALMQRVTTLLPPAEWLTRPKRSRIFMRDRFLPYPPSPLSLFGVFGPQVFAAIERDYLRARLDAATERRQEPATFAAELKKRVDASLYRELFAPIATKL